jgi:ligand-binding sensor domain-containing protein
MRQDGLPANGINAICQTKDGFLWLGAQKGLVRFDGVEFSVFRLPEDPHFRFQEISALSVSRNGGLWFGIQNGAFGHYDPDTGFTHLPDERWIQPGMDVRALREAGDGSLWVGGTCPATRYVCGHTNLTQAVAGAAGCITIFEDSKKRVWLGTLDQKFQCWEGGRLTPFPDGGITNALVLSMAEDPLGQIWVGTQFGLRCYDASLRRQPIPPQQSKIAALLVDRWGVLWLATCGNGLWRFKDGKYSSMGRLDGLADDDVTALFEDREGSLWVGTRNGLSRTPKACPMPTECAPPPAGACGWRPVPALPTWTGSGP